MFEHHKSPLLSRWAFYRRLAGYFIFSQGVAGVALGVGMAGYHWLEHIPWLDAFDSAAMILSGMGPLTAPQTVAGKLFSGCYALFSGLVFITVAGIILAPLTHRLLHKFHIQDQEKP